ncbi:MAG: hypothetical protein GXO64_02910 [Candidatus Micrarchaeota archaeon]|nr:hypothetical protein [Candidatus Micrarchaeota archaeon]
MEIMDLMEEDLFDIGLDETDLEEIIDEDDDESEGDEIVVLEEDEEGNITYSVKKKEKYADDEHENEKKYVESTEHIYDHDDIDDEYSTCMGFGSQFNHFYEWKERVKIEYSVELPAIGGTTSDIVPDITTTANEDHIEETTYYDNEPKPSFEVIKYEQPVVMDYSHKDYVHEQILIENNIENEINAYDLVNRIKSELGIKADYSEEFGSIYINEINGTRDGQNGMWWEFYIIDENNNVRIGENSIDKTILKKGERLEWRLASEEPGACGGVINDNADARIQSIGEQLRINYINQGKSSMGIKYPIAA